MGGLSDPAITSEVIAEGGPDRRGDRTRAVHHLLIREPADAPTGVLESALADIVGGALPAGCVRAVTVDLERKPLFEVGEVELVHRGPRQLYSMRDDRPWQAGALEQPEHPT